MVGHRGVTSEVTRGVTHGVTLKEKEVPSLKIKNIMFSRSEAARREDLISDLKVKGAAKPAITLTAGTGPWDAWMELLRNRDRHDLIERAEAAEQIVVVSRWPHSESRLPFVPNAPKRRGAVT